MVQWQNATFPRLRRGFDSLHSLQIKQNLEGPRVRRDLENLNVLSCKQHSNILKNVGMLFALFLYCPKFDPVRGRPRQQTSATSTSGRSASNGIE